MNTKLMFSSATDLWSTPQDFFEGLTKEFNFTLDVCASSENAKCPIYYTEICDGLIQDWHRDAHGGVCWMNPPYGKYIKQWVKKAYETCRTGTTVVCLLPARTDTAWFQDYCLPFGEIRFIRGRLKFGGQKNSAPFPSVIIIFRANL